jgi:hypothetical protein
MANVLEQGKRGYDLPRLLNGNVHTYQRYSERTPEERTASKMPPLMYVVEASKSFPTTTNGAGFRTEAFSMQFTEDEMIRITGDWLTMMNCRRIDAANEARKLAERDACLSKTSQPISD